MAARTQRGIPLSAVSPHFLHSNSTSHTGPFSAIAELIDNAYDPDVNAKKIWIDKTVIKGQDCLIFMDSGNGMEYDTMHKMLSFGFSDKLPIKGRAPIGLYGNGFKSGSMRLGKDVIVFSKKANTMCVGLLSQTYLEKIKAQNVIVPIVKFTKAGQTDSVAQEYKECLCDILTHSLFNTSKELLSEFSAINGPYDTKSSGTRIIIWNLRKMSSGGLEFDFTKDRYDIQLPVENNENTKEANKKPESGISAPKSEYSLRAFSSILYLKPRMQIIIRGQKVKSQLVSKSLAYVFTDIYRPTFLKETIKITFGYNTESKDHFGLMIYHKNRLIKAYEHVACQRKANKTGVRVVGVLECNYLTPMHNKQDFENTEEYRKTMNNVSSKLEEYWKEVRYRRQNCSVPVEDDVKRPDQNWVQCDTCRKWRKLPDGINNALLPDEWFCHMNPDPQFRNCAVEEEPEDSEDEQSGYQKTYKQDEKLQKEKERLQMEQDKARKELVASAKENADYLKPGSPTQRLPYTPLNSHLPRNAGSRSANILAASPISVRNKRGLGPKENREMKNKRIKHIFDSSTPEKPSTSASPKFCSSPNRIIYDGDTVVSMETTEDLPPISLRDVSIGTQTQQNPAVKQEEENSKGEKKERGSKDGESTHFESEKYLPSVEMNSSTELKSISEETRLQQKRCSSIHRDISYEISGDGQTEKLENSVLSVLEAQQQQDKLLEFLEVVTKERDESQTQLLLLKSEVEELRSQLLELNQSMLKKEHSEHSTQTSQEEAQDYQVLYLHGKEEIKQLQEELKQLKIEKKEKESQRQQASLECDELACQVDLLLGQIDQGNNKREELINTLDCLENEKSTLSASCESLKKELEKMKRDKEKIKLFAEDRGVQTDFPIVSHEQSAATSAKASTFRSGTDCVAQQHETHRLRDLRQKVARLLITFVPVLDLQQVNYDCSVIDEILTQVVNEISPEEAAAT